MELLWFLFYIMELYISSTQGCRLWMCDAPDNHALLVHPDGSSIIYPDKVEDRGDKCSRAIDIPERESVIAACPDPSENKLKIFEKSFITLTCHNDRLVTEDDERLVTEDIEVDWSDLECSGKLNPFILISDMSCGDQQGDIISIGWNIDENMFVPQIEICFNKELEITLYEHHLIHGRYIDARDSDDSSPKWKHVEGYSRDAEIVGNLYPKDNQAILLERLLGGKDYLDELGLNPREEDFLSRGHLAPNADFVSLAEQDATYYYVNAVPQWQDGFNARNWLILEKATRDLAIEKEQTLSIWSGTHEVLHLPDDQGNSVDIYLGLLENEKILPVPELMWKVVSNPTENQSIVFIGRNDIRESNDNDFNKPCENICTDIKWVEFKNSDKKGKMICCSLQDAKNVISILPELDDTSLLRG